MIGSFTIAITKYVRVISVYTLLRHRKQWLMWDTHNFLRGASGISQIFFMYGQDAVYSIVWFVVVLAVLVVIVMFLKDQISLCVHKKICLFGNLRTTSLRCLRRKSSRSVCSWKTIHKKYIYVYIYIIKQCSR